MYNHEFILLALVAAPLVIVLSIGVVAFAVRLWSSENKWLRLVGAAIVVLFMVAMTPVFVGTGCAGGTPVMDEDLGNRC